MENSNLNYHKFIFFLFIISTVFSVQKINLPPINYTDWVILKSDDTWVGWTELDGFPICKAKKIIPYNIKTVAHAIEDKQNYPLIFDRITQVNLYEEDIIHIYLDMPFPISSRDYIVQYYYSEINGIISYKFFSVEHPNSVDYPNAIRLPNAGGEWILKPLNDKTTEVAYVWNGELLGDFPDWALTRAWVTQGSEVLDWLNEFLERKNKLN